MRVVTYIRDMFRTLSVVRGSEICGFVCVFKWKGGRARTYSGGPFTNKQLLTKYIEHNSAWGTNVFFSDI